MKLLIPTILTATILIAASFAFMPVQKAESTHLPTITAGTIPTGTLPATAVIGTAATLAGPNTFAGTTTLGSAGTPITRINVFSLTLTPASVAAATAPEQTFTVTGLATTDKVFVNGPAPTAGVTIGGVRVSAANTLAIQFVNPTAGAVVPASGTYIIVAIGS